MKEEAIEGEVLGPESDLTFDWFWDVSGQIGMQGPALRRWKKLTKADRCAIRDLYDRGELDLQGVWACTWLDARRWEAPVRPKQTKFDLEQFMPVQRRRVVLHPDQPEFKAEYQRRLRSGEDIAMMEGAMRRGGLCTLDQGPPQ